MILSGTMTVSGSDAEDLPIDSLIFERDGSMRLLLLDNSEDSDVDSIILVSDYFQYALSRSDWMIDFINLSLQDEEVLTHTHKPGTKSIPHLRVIEGGLSQTTGANTL